MPGAKATLHWNGRATTVAVVVACLAAATLIIGGFRSQGTALAGFKTEIRQDVRELGERTTAVEVAQPFDREAIRRLEGKVDDIHELLLTLASDR